MPRVDSTTASEYKALDYKRMKKISRENPHLTKQDIYKNHRGDPTIS